jgi:hypothetical protein
MVASSPGVCIRRAGVKAINNKVMEMPYFTAGPPDRQILRALKSLTYDWLNCCEFCHRTKRVCQWIERIVQFLSIRSDIRPPRRTEIPTLNTRKLFNRTASVLGRPRRTEVPTPNTRKLFSRSASVLGRPRRTEPPSPNTRTLFSRSASVLGRPRRTEVPTPNTRTLFSRSASVLGRPVDQNHHPLTH